MAYMTKDNKKFVRQHEVASYDCDKQQNIKVSAIQRWLQDNADDHCSVFGCDYITLKDKMDMVFVLVKTSINIYEPLKLLKNYTFKTWHKGSKGVQFLRDFVIENEHGVVVAEGGTSWVVVDPVLHKMKRPNEVTFVVPVCEESVDTTRLEKMHMPELDYITDKKVMYTEIDSNQHLTNWVYADIVTNYLPSMEGKRIAEMDISYISEAFEGESIRIFRAQKDGVWYFRGEHPRGKCFEARCRIVDSEH